MLYQSQSTMLVKQKMNNINGNINMDGWYPHSFWLITHECSLAFSFLDPSIGGEPFYTNLLTRDENK